MNKLILILITLMLGGLSCYQAIAVELTVTPERAAPAGTIHITSKLPALPATGNLVITDAYRGTELLRSRKPLVRNNNGTVEVAYAFALERN